MTQFGQNCMCNYFTTSHMCVCRRQGWYADAICELCRDGQHAFELRESRSAVRSVTIAVSRRESEQHAAGMKILMEKMELALSALQNSRTHRRRFHGPVKAKEKFFIEICDGTVQAVSGLARLRLAVGTYLATWVHVSYEPKSLLWEALLVHGAHYNQGLTILCEEYIEEFASLHHTGTAAKFRIVDASVLPAFR